MANARSKHVACSTILLSTCGGGDMHCGVAVLWDVHAIVMVVHWFACMVVLVTLTCAHRSI